MYLMLNNVPQMHTHTDTTCSTSVYEITIGILAGTTALFITITICLVWYICFKDVFRHEKVNKVCYNHV